MLGGGGVLGLFELLVEVLEEHAESIAADDGDAEHGCHDTVALAVAVFGEIPDVGAGDVTELTEGVDHGDGDGTLGWRTGEGCTDPGVEDDESVGF